MSPEETSQLGHSAPASQLESDRPGKQPSGCFGQPEADLRSAIIWTGIAVIAAATLFLSFPEIDLAVASWFYTGEGRLFLLTGSAPAEWIRDIFQGVFILLCVVALLALAGHALFSSRLFGLDSRRASYVLLCFALGPGLLVNVILKNHWDRARPNDIAQFGGEREFTPPLIIADQCGHNCSFVSGEASMGFAFLALALLATAARRRLYVWVSIGLGCFIGLVRMGMGKHFFSDVLFAGLFTALLVMTLYHFMAGRRM